MQGSFRYLLLGGLLMLGLPACDSGASSAVAAGTGQNSPVQSQAAAPQIAPPPPIERKALKTAIARVMRAQYPLGYDEANRCWRTERGDGNEATAYCMRPLPEHVVQQGDAASVYVALASASDIRGNPDYLYGQVDAGVMDAFRLSIPAEGEPTIAARGLGLAFGSAGDCGCANARFVQVGPRTYGWMFTSGGTWQGRTVASHALVAPVGGEFKDVAALPRYVEDDQSVEYRLAIARATSGDWYPLRHSQWRDGEFVDETRIEFDPAAARYKAVGAR